MSDEPVITHQTRSEKMTMTMKTIAERQEMAHVAMDIKLFLRMARTNFTHAKDHAVINKLEELADQWGAGVDIMQPPLKNTD